MGLCSLRTFCLTNCLIQLIFTTLRQVFDFLGFMWGPILVNFFQILFAIFGFFGAYQYRPNYTIAYSVWCVFSCCWNIFVTCFYFNILGLDKDSDLLNLGTGSFSWWLANGPGCKPLFSPNLSSLEVTTWRPQRPDSVSDCIVLYQHLEAAQAIIHLIMAAAGVVSGTYLSWSLLDEDDSFDFLGAFESKSPQHLALQPKFVHYASVPSQSDNLLTLTRGFKKQFLSSDGTGNKNSE